MKRTKINEKEAEIGPYFKKTGRKCSIFQVVSVLAFYSDDPCSNPAEVYSFSVIFLFEKSENKQKSGRGRPIKEKIEKRK